jgi:anti-sigma B factor antagonist
VQTAISCYRLVGLPRVEHGRVDGRSRTVGNASLAFDLGGDGDEFVVAVSGEVDLATAPQLEECLLAHADRNVTVDLAGVSFLDSCGLHALVMARNRLHERGYELRTVNEQDHVRRVLELTGLNQLFHEQ